MAGDRRQVGMVSRRHGAYLCAIYQTANEGTGFATPDELADAASNLARAKRVLVAMARSFGFDGAVRWSEDATGQWTLTMTNDEEDR